MLKLHARRWVGGLAAACVVLAGCTARPSAEIAAPPQSSPSSQRTPTSGGAAPSSPTATTITITPSVSSPPSTRTPSTPGSPPSTRTPSGPSPNALNSLCPLPITGFDCAFQRRIIAAQAYIRTRPGTVGIVLRDRQTGAVWRNEYADTMVWTASTIKLAMVVDLYIRQGQGLITLTATDKSEIQAMLHSSDDDAADALWFRYAGSDHYSYNRRFAAYGMTSLQPQSGFTNYFPYWGFQKCTPADLDRLMQYVLTKLPAAERGYIVEALQHVDPDQQWGVWGAGPAGAPGNKDGWSEEASGWVLNSVGFIGPNQRYTLAIMNSLNGHGGYTDGTTTDSRVAQLLFR